MLGEGAWVTPNVRLVRVIGAGGMGSVWLAEHTTLRTSVVVKLMRPDLARDPETLHRFSREAAAAANVKSPHVVQVLDHGVAPDGSPFIMMEFLEGEDLGARLKRGNVPPDEAAIIIAQTCKALGRAHERGIVHRDVKPQNIFMCSTFGETFVKVLDFGIAKAGGDLQAGLDTTSTGAVMGTPYYMSPEQALGQKTIDLRTDVWAVGVVGFEMVTGRKPFVGDTVGAVAVAICTQPLPLPSSVNPALGASVDAWFVHACAREPSSRFSSAKELADAFAQAVSGPTSLGLAKTVASVPPPALPVLAASGHRDGALRDPSSTTGPTSRGAETHTSSSRSAGIIAIVVAGACLTFGGTLAYRARSVGSASVPPAASSSPTELDKRAPSASASASGHTRDEEVVSVESLPRASASAPAPPAAVHGVSTASATVHATTRPAQTFDRNSIE
jgi:serine/threonine-protein kinase